MSEAAYPAALTLGAVSGMRSMMAPAVISWAARKAGLDLESTPFSAFNNGGVRKATMLAAIGEVVADKLPFIPARTGAAPMLTRAISGGAAGAAVCKARNRSVVAGALVGAAAAIGAAYGAYYLRKQAARRFDVSDRTIAVIEDGIALAAGLIAIASLRPPKPKADQA